MKRSVRRARKEAFDVQNTIKMKYFESIQRRINEESNRSTWLMKTGQRACCFEFIVNLSQGNIYNSSAKESVCKLLKVALDVCNKVSEKCKIKKLPKGRKFWYLTKIWNLKVTYSYFNISFWSSLKRCKVVNFRIFKAFAVLIKI